MSAGLSNMTIRKRADETITLIAFAVSDTHAGREAVTMANLFQLKAIKRDTTLFDT